MYTMTGCSSYSKNIEFNVGNRDNVVTGLI